MTLRTGLYCLFTFIYAGAHAQTIASAGIFTGFSIPLTLDQGINKDPRYQTRYDIKWAPIGINLGVDFEGFSVLANPSVTTIGQNFYVANTVGGQVGRRNSDLTYIQLPIGMKLHLIDMSFFRVSLVGSLGAAFMLQGKETITHEPSKLWFPYAAYPNLPDGYAVEYDGVDVPDINDQEIVGKGDFKAIQFFSTLGLRSDWDVSEKMRISMDVRANYYFGDPRSATYINKVKNYEAIYDIYGKRTEAFVSFTIGVSRIVQLDRKETAHKKIKFKSSNKRRKPN